MTVSLLLMTQKGLEVLNALLKNGYKVTIDKIIIGEDTNVSNDFSKEIASVCQQHDLQFIYHKDDFKLTSDYVLAVSWRWLIKNLEATILIVFHDSLLPKYRGFSPLVNCLINNEKTIGVTSLFAAEEYDKGNIIFQDSMTIEYPIKISEAIEKISELYVSLALKVLDYIKNDKALPSHPQDESKATYSLWRHYDDYFIDWNQDAAKIKRYVDALGTPYRGAKSFLDNKVVTINDVTIIDDVTIENRDVGKVIFSNEGLPVIVCGKGLLQINDAAFDTNKEPLVPLKKFRLRLK